MSQAPDRLAPLADVREEGLRIVQAAEERGLLVRLIGGVAVWARCPSGMLPQLRREYGDIDVVGHARQSKELTALLESMGYQPDKLFNAIHGAQRLNFEDAATGRPLDVLLDKFVMCHALNLRDRLAVDELTIPLADLLLTKLQVVQINDKDMVDLAALLADHAPGTATDHENIDLGRFTDVLDKDWGFEQTVRLNLAKVREYAAGRELPEQLAARIDDRIGALLSALDTSGKTVGWKLRGKVGERVRWYELPEEGRH